MWFQDEMRVGQKNGLVYQWVKKGTRPRQPKDQRYANAYVFGAICPARDTGTALVLPRADADAMQHHLDAISRCVAPSAHAVLTLDKAGWGGGSHRSARDAGQQSVKVHEGWY